MPRATRLLVVRHGQSTWNAEGRWQGHADPPLSVVGEQQAAQAAAALTSEGIEAVVSSPLRRAHHTAQVIAAALGLPEPDTMDEWKERHAGEFEGLTTAEIEQRWPGATTGPRRIEPPGGERRADFEARIRRALDLTIERHTGQVVAVVAHGGVIRAIEACCGAERGPIPNLVAWWVSGEGGALVAGDRRLLVAEGPDNPARPIAP